MEYRRLGNAGLKVSSIAFGGWINYGEGKVPTDEARRCVEKAHDLGINFFDLADVYGRGEAEKQMGAVLKQYPRHTLVISSKVFWPMSEDVNDKGLSRKHILESIDKTLQRLGTDYIDMYFCHRPDPETPLLETAWAMHDLVTRGKVLYWGTSEWSGAQIAEVCDLCDRYNLHRPRVEQPNFSMLKRDVVLEDVLPVIRTRGIGLVAFSPMAQGMLTGKYDDGVPAGSRFERETWAKDRVMTQESVNRVRRLKAIADKLGISRAQLALAWVISHNGVTSAITSATKVSQIEESVKAAEISLNDEVMAEIRVILES